MEGTRIGPLTIGGTDAGVDIEADMRTVEQRDLAPLARFAPPGGTDLGDRRGVGSKGNDRRSQANRPYEKAVALSTERCRQFVKRLTHAVPRVTMLLAT
jgi:hypothetical protein